MFLLHINHSPSDHVWACMYVTGVCICIEIFVVSFFVFYSLAFSSKVALSRKCISTVCVL
jgi:hypothetical protein